MAVVGAAEVRIRPSLVGFHTALQAGIAGSAAQIGAVAGAKSGQGFNKGFATTAGVAGAAASGKAGRKAGSTWGREWERAAVGVGAGVGARAGRKVGRNFGGALGNATSSAMAATAGNAVGRTMYAYSDELNGRGTVEMERSGGRLGRALNIGMKAALVGGAVTVGLATVGTLGKVIQGGFRRAVAMDDARAMMRAYQFSAEEVALAMENVDESTQRTAIDLGDMSVAAAQLMGSGIQAGNELTKNLKVVGNTAAATGSNVSDIGAIFAKVSASNRLQLAEANQMVKRGVPIFKALADELDVAQDDVRDYISKGEVDYATFAAAMGAITDGAAEEYAKTWSGSIAYMTGYMSRVGMHLVEPVIEPLKEGMRAFGDWLGAAEPMFEAVGGMITNFFDGLKGGGDSMGPFMGALSTLGEIIVDTGTWIWEYLITPMWEIVSVIGGSVWETITTAVGFFTDLYHAFRDGADGGADLAGVVGGILTSAFDTIGGVVDWVTEKWDALVSMLNFSEESWESFSETVSSVFDRVTPFIERHAGKIEKLLLIYAGWKSAQAGWSVAKMIGGFGKATVEVVKNTGAMIANRAAMVKSKLETIYLAGVIAKDWIVTQARAIASWGRETAAMIANRAQVVAQTVIRKAQSWTTFIGMQARAIANWVRETTVMVAQRAAMVASTVATNAMAVAQRALNAVMRANPIGIIITVLVALVTAIVTAYKNSETFRNIVQGAWEAIKTAATVAWDWLKKKVFKPLGKMFERVGKIAADVGAWIVETWDSIWNAALKAWDWMRDKVFTPLGNIIENMKGWFGSASRTISDRWDATMTGLKKPWDWLVDKVFNPLKTFITETIPNAFTSGKDAIGRAWDQIKEIAAKPVNFVIGTVYNDGLRKWFNNIVGFLGVGKELPRANLVKFAQGSEDHRAQIARAGDWRVWAEPETGGEAYIPLAKSKRRRSTQILGQVAQKFGYNITPFAEGGFWGRVKGVGSWVKDAATSAWEGLKSVGDFLLNPIDKVRDLIVRPVKALADQVGSSRWAADAAGGLPRYVVDQIGGAVRRVFQLDKVEENEAAKNNPYGDGGIPPVRGGWARPSFGPVTSRYGARPGLAGLTGSAFHNGIDIAGGGRTFAAKAGRVLATGWNILPTNSGIGILIGHGGGWATYYGHNPVGGVQVRAGQNVKQGQHIGYQGATGNVTGVHLHFGVRKDGRFIDPAMIGLFDGGGFLKPGMMAYHSATMSKPDAVLTAQQWDDIHTLAKRGEIGSGTTVYNVDVPPEAFKTWRDFERFLEDGRRHARQRAGVSFK